jgi:predicted anti-sigma-YlaC factor YlaD
LDCNEVLEQLADYLDADERDALCVAIQEHLAHCRDCKINVDTLRKTIVLYQNGHPAEVPVRISEALQAAMAREYDRAAKSPPSD